MKRRALLLAATLAPSLLAPAQELTFRHLAGTDGGRGWNDGPLATARLDTPGGVVADAAGNLYVSDRGRHTIRIVTTSGVVTTLAGLAGVAGSADGTGISGFFNGPTGLALDDFGNLWVADMENHTIRKVSPAGVVTTVAGRAGISGLADGTGSTARFSYPRGLWWDSAGARLLVADSANGRVRSVTPAGAVSTLRVQGGAGAVFVQPVSVTANGLGDVFVVEGWDKHTVARLTAAGGLVTFAGTDYNSGADDGPVYVGRFRYPSGVVADSSGILWVADCGNHALRRVSRTGVISTVAGLSGEPGSADGAGPAARFDCPFAIGRDGAGRFAVADTNNGTLRRLTSSGVVTTVAGRAREGGHADGTGDGARFGGPAGVVVDEEGNALVADRGSATIRKVTPEGVVTTVAGAPGDRGHVDGAAGVARLGWPWHLARDASGSLFVTSEFHATVRRVSPDGSVTTLAGDPSSTGSQDGTGSAARFVKPRGLAVDASGNCWVADYGMDAVRKVTPEGVVTTLRNLTNGAGEPGEGEPFGGFSGPADVEFGPDGYLYVAEADAGAVRKVSPDGRVFTVAGLPGALGARDGTGMDARLGDLAALAFAPGGGLLVLERGPGRVRRISADGVVTTVAGPAAGGSQAEEPILFRIAPDGTGSGARFGSPGGIAAAPDGRVLVSDLEDLVVRAGVPAFEDRATVEPALGAVGARRALGAAPRTATSWLWEAVRIEAGSTALLESATTADSGFTPDVEGHFAFRLSASGPSAARLSAVSLSAGAIRPTAVLAPRLAETCSGVPFELRVDLTGTPPWTVAWSDGFVQTGIASSPATRTVEAPAELALESVSDANGPGSVSGASSLSVLAAPAAVVVGSQSIYAGGTAYLHVDLSGQRPFLLTWSDGVKQTCAVSSCVRAVRPTATTTYSVVSLADADCSGTGSGSATVTVLPALPTATVSGSTTICAGQSAELRADLTGQAPWTVTWSDGFVDQGLPVSPSRRVVTPGSTTAYTVTSVSDTLGSGSGDGSATVTVLAGPAPSTAIDVPSPVAPGTTGITASVPDAGPGATYAWTITNGVLTSGQGSRSIVFSAGQAGPLVLRVTVSVSGGCTASGSMRVWVGADPASRIDFSRLAGPDGPKGWFDGPGESARFMSPVGVAIDAAGNAYVLDSVGAVRKVTPGGEVSTLAGGTVDSMTAADGRGALAQFYSPRGIACTPAGVVFVADAGNHLIRRIDPSGDVTTVAGTTGMWGSADGIGADARFHFPAALALDQDGNLFVADMSNHVIRKVTPTGVVTTVAGLAGSSGSTDGTGSAARFYWPSGIALGPDGNVYVAETGNSTIRRVTPAGSVTTIAGLARSKGSADGPAADARFNEPSGVAVDGDGNVFVADSGNFTIRVVTVAGNVTTLAGVPLASGSDDGTGAAARFALPRGIAWDPTGALVVADRDNCTIRRVSASGDVQTVAGHPAGEGSADGPGPAARFDAPYDVAIAPDGSAWVADSWNHCIRRITASGVVATVAGACGAIGSADGPGGVARFYFPAGIAVSSSGDVYVSDTGNETIRRIGSSGDVTTIAGLAGYNGSRDGTGLAARFYSPWGIAVDADDNVYVSDHDNHTVRKITPSGVVTTLAGRAGVIGSTDGTGSGAAFRRPTGLDVDRFGNVYVSDNENGTIRKVTRGGLVTTLAGVAQSMGDSDGVGSTARFSAPGGLRVDGSGKLWVTDGRLRVRTVTPEGVVTTIAGGRNFGSAGGTAGDAMIAGAQGMGLRWNGELLVTDRISHGIWEGAPALADEARIDLAQGPVGETRHLDAQPRTATSWRWELVRTESASSAVLSSVDVPDPTFTPDTPGYYRFRLTAMDGVRKSVTMVSLYVDLPPATAVVTGSVLACQPQTFSVRSYLTGIPPWTVTWSDGKVWTDTPSPTGLRQFQTDEDMSLSIVAVSDARGPGVPSGVAEIIFPPRTATPVLQAPAIVGEGSPGRRASVAGHPGSTYSWEVSGGSITAGQGTNEIVFSMYWVGTNRISVSETAPGKCPSSSATAMVQVVPAGGATLFYPVMPCRLLDTREASGPTGGEPLGATAIGTFDAAGLCGIPMGARAISANVTATQGTGSGTLVVYPADVAKPLAATTPVAPGKTRAASTHVKLPTSGSRQIAVANDSPGTVHVIVDVSGYYR